MSGKTRALFPNHSSVSKNALGQWTQSYHRENIRDVAKASMREPGWAEPVTFALSQDEFTLEPEGALGHNGIGDVLEIDRGSIDVPFENASGVTYYVGLTRVSVPAAVEATPRAGLLFQYTAETDYVGYGAVAPNAVVSTSPLQLRVDVLGGAGDDLTGRDVLVWLVDPRTSYYAAAVETCTVTYSGGNIVELSGTLGQTDPSTTASRYRVALVGPRVSRTDFSAESGVLFVGTVVGTGSGTTPTVSSTSGQLSLVTDATQLENSLEGVFQDALVSGAAVTGVSGLDVTLSAGKFLLGGRYVEFASQTVTVANNATRYLVADRATGTYTAISSVNDAYLSGVCALYKIVTSGGAVTSRKPMRLPSANVHKQTQIRVGKSYPRYGSDYRETHFDTITEAVQYIECLGGLTGSNKDMLYEIVVCGPVDEAAEVTIPVDGITIRAAGSDPDVSMAVSWSHTGALFDLNGKDRIRLHNLCMVYKASAISDDVCAIRNSTGTAENFVVRDCLVKGDARNPAAVVSCKSSEGSLSYARIENVIATTRGGFVHLAASTNTGNRVAACVLTVSATGGASALSPFSVKGNYNRFTDNMLGAISVGLSVDGYGNRVRDNDVTQATATSIVLVSKDSIANVVDGNFFQLAAISSAFTVIETDNTSGSGAAHRLSNNIVLADAPTTTPTDRYAIKSGKSDSVIIGNIAMAAQISLGANALDNVLMGDVVVGADVVVNGAGAVLAGCILESGGGIDVDAASVVVGCLVDSASGIAIDVDAAKSVVVGCATTSSASVGIYVRSTGAAVSGCVSDAAGSYGVQVSNGANAISGTLARGSTSHGFHVGSDVAVSGCFAYSAGAAGFYLAGARTAVSGCATGPTASYGFQITGDQCAVTGGVAITTGSHAILLAGTADYSTVVGCVGSPTNGADDAAVVSAGATNNVVVGNAFTGSGYTDSGTTTLDSLSAMGGDLNKA